MEAGVVQWRTLEGVAGELQVPRHASGYYSSLPAMVRLHKVASCFDGPAECDDVGTRGASRKC